MSSFRNSSSSAAKMKFLLAFLVAIAASSVAHVNAGPVSTSYDLQDDLADFLALVPKEKVVAIFMEYLETDKEVQRIMEYMSSNEFKDLVKKIESIADVKNFCDYLQDSGLDVYGLINKFHEVIGLPPIVTGKVSPTVRITGGIAGLWEDIKAVLPIEKIKALYYEKLETSPAFAELIKRLSSPRFQELVNALRKNSEFRKIVAFLNASGINVNDIKDILTTIFGLDFSKQLSLTRPAFPRANSDLLKDLKEFVALLPTQEMSEIAINYLSHPDVQKAMAYIKSEEFKALAINAQQSNDVLAFIEYLEVSGLPMYQYINGLNSYLGIPEIKPHTLGRSMVLSANGLRQMLDEIEALLPREAIKSLYQQKLRSSPAFIFLIRRLTSPEFQHLVDRLIQDPSVREIGNRAAEFGIDIPAISKLMFKIFGIEIPSSV